MGLGSVKVRGKKFSVKEMLGLIKLDINNMEIEEISEIKGLNKQKMLHL